MREGFCNSLSLLILRFTFVELFKWKNKIKKKGKIYRHKFMHVSRSTKLLTNHSWQVWRSIYNNHIDVKISPTMIWVHREQAMLVNAQGHLYEGTRPFGSIYIISFDISESKHLIVRSMPKIFNILNWWASLWLFGHHTFS